MQVIGLIGGTTWLSTIDYYRFINEAVAARLGGLHSAKILLYSVDFGEIVAAEQQGQLATEVDILCDAASRLQRGGAQLIALCANTAHVFADVVSHATTLPLIDIRDALAQALNAAKLPSVAILSTQRTRAAGLFDERFAQAVGCDVLWPHSDEQQAVDSWIREGAQQGGFSAEHTAALTQLINRLASRGAKGVVLACTELPIMLADSNTDLPLFDTTRLHAKAIVDAALA